MILYYYFFSLSNHSNSPEIACMHWHRRSHPYLFIFSCLLFVVQYLLRWVIYHDRDKQWVNQQCGRQCVTNTQRHLLGVCSTKIDCARGRFSLSRFLSLPRPLASSLLLLSDSAPRKMCDAKRRTVTRRRTAQLITTTRKKRSYFLITLSARLSFPDQTFFCARVYLWFCYLNIIWMKMSKFNLLKLIFVDIWTLICISTTLYS